MTKLKTKRLAKVINKESSSKSLKNASAARTAKTARHVFSGMPVTGFESAKNYGSKPSLPNDWTTLTVAMKLVEMEAVSPNNAHT